MYTKPKSLWGYDLVSSAYKEEPWESWLRIYGHVRKLFPKAAEPQRKKELWEKHNLYKWNLIEPVLRPYYAKDNPYYGVEVPAEKQLFFQKLEELKNREEQKEI